MQSFLKKQNSINSSLLTFNCCCERGGTVLRTLPGDIHSSLMREAAKKKRFFGEIFPKCGWVGWLFPKQGQNPSKPPQITPKIAFFDPNSTFSFPKSYKNPGVGGLHIFGKTLSFRPSLMRYWQNSCYQVTWFRFPHLNADNECFPICSMKVRRGWCICLLWGNMNAFKAYFHTMDFFDLWFSNCSRAILQSPCNPARIMSGKTIFQVGKFVSGVGAGGIF